MTTIANPASFLGFTPTEALTLAQASQLFQQPPLSECDAVACPLNLQAIAQTGQPINHPSVLALKRFVDHAAQCVQQPADATQTPVISSLRLEKPEWASLQATVEGARHLANILPDPKQIMLLTKTAEILALRDTQLTAQTGAWVFVNRGAQFSWDDFREALPGLQVTTDPKNNTAKVAVVPKRLWRDLIEARKNPFVYYSGGFNFHTEERMIPPPLPSPGQTVVAAIPIIVPGNTRVLSLQKYYPIVITTHPEDDTVTIQIGPAALDTKDLPLGAERAEAVLKYLMYAMIKVRDEIRMAAKQRAAQTHPPSQTQIAESIEPATNTSQQSIWTWMINWFKDFFKFV